MNLNDSKTVHDAITSWTENVNTQNFTVCAMQSGRKRKNFNPFATVNWLAYQGAPPHGMTGQIMMQGWWSGTNCADLNFPKFLHLPRSYNATPTVLISANHSATAHGNSVPQWNHDMD
ncbi:hypothetical protein AWC38_SpisGene24579 [Stylophora pistillata]|uniref:Uncharacterized protein n=1 Tax=Stylophora pistillata TaxID=50429 RepID=A0A2B4QZL0_STYPI|nr:hypothetical protein AWC38_SpisGene24579 [Stylophora pistillata]